MAPMSSILRELEIPKLQAKTTKKLRVAISEKCHHEL